MGVTMCCKKGKKSIDLTYNGFSRFRTRVSMLACPEWGEKYSKITTAYSLPEDEKNKFFDELDEITEAMIKKKQVSKLVVDFCFQSDCGGKISPKACKQIYDIIKDYTEEGIITYGYAAHKDCPRFEDIKALIELCCDTKCYLTWY